MFFPRGELLVGVLVITAFVFSDLVDGHMARLSGTVVEAGARSSTPRSTGSATRRSSPAWRCTTSAPATPTRWPALAIYCLVMGSVTSYARARAESLGMQAKGGIAERADRLVAILVMTGLRTCFDLPWCSIPITLGALAVASTITVVQRILSVRSQARATV